jgi:hypothetical protein
MNKEILLLLVLPTCVSCAKQQGTLAPDTAREVITRYHGHVSLDVQNTVAPSRHNLDESMDSVWSVLPSVYQQIGIEPELVDNGNYLIGHTRFVARRLDGNRLSRYVTCGSSVGYADLADSYRVTLSVITRVRRGENLHTLLQTEVAGSAMPRQVSGNSVTCATTGKLEQRIAELTSTLLDPER